MILDITNIRDQFETIIDGYPLFITYDNDLLYIAINKSNGNKICIYKDRKLIFTAKMHTNKLRTYKYHAVNKSIYYVSSDYLYKFDIITRSTKRLIKYPNIKRFGLSENGQYIFTMQSKPTIQFYTKEGTHICEYITNMARPEQCRLSNHGDFYYLSDSYKSTMCKFNIFTRFRRARKVAQYKYVYSAINDSIIVNNTSENKLVLYKNFKRIKYIQNYEQTIVKRNNDMCIAISDDKLRVIDCYLDIKYEIKADFVKQLSDFCVDKNILMYYDHTDHPSIHFHDLATNTHLMTIPDIQLTMVRYFDSDKCIITRLGHKLTFYDLTILNYPEQKIALLYSMKIKGVMYDPLFDYNIFSIISGYLPSPINKI